jgi:hypothetical protein
MTVASKRWKAPGLRPFRERLYRFQYMQMAQLSERPINPKNLSLRPGARIPLALACPRLNRRRPPRGIDADDLACAAVRDFLPRQSVEVESRGVVQKGVLGDDEFPLGIPVGIVGIAPCLQE